MNRKLTIDQLPFGRKITGYIWLSDAQNPYCYHNDELSKRSEEHDIEVIKDNSNPFIVEGQLYCDSLKKSYSIKYVDGRHIIIEYDLTKIPQEWECVEKEYIPNRINVDKLRFKLYWKPEVDELCEGMEALVPAAMVFVGFKNKEVKK